MAYLTVPRLNKILRKSLTITGLADNSLRFLQKRYERLNSEYLMLHGMRVHYTDEGQGPVLILLHGFMASLHTWDGWVTALRPHYRILCIDLPGFGLTGEHPQHRYHPFDYVRFLDDFRRQLGISRFHLAGNSLGGAIAWCYAQQFPERVEKLVLLNPAGYQQSISGMLRLVINPVAMKLLQRTLPRFVITMGLREVYGNPARIRSGTDRRYHDLMLRPGNRLAITKVAQMLADLNATGQLEKEIPHLKVPTLLMWGALDRWIPASLAYRWQADVPHIQIKIYEGVGHVPMEEIPETSALDAHRFLSG